MKKSRNCLDYVVIRTGYTARLVNKLAFNNIDVINEAMSNELYKNGVYRISHSYSTVEKRDLHIQSVVQFDDFFETYEISIDKFIDNCLFINDGLWGNGLYKVGDDTEIDKVLNVLKLNDINTTGIVCLKCNTRSDIIGYLGTLKDLHYCNMVEYCGDEYVDTDEMIITIVEYDTESG